MKLSFKKDKKETGLAGVANPYPSVTIKGDKLQVGRIYHARGVGFRVHIMVKKEKTPEDPCDFKWIFFKAIFNEEDEAREFVKKYWDKWQTEYEIYQIKD